MEVVALLRGARTLSAWAGELGPAGVGTASVKRSARGDRTRRGEGGACSPTACGASAALVQWGFTRVVAASSRSHGSSSWSRPAAAFRWIASEATLSASRLKACCSSVPSPAFPAGGSPTETSSSSVVGQRAPRPAPKPAPLHEPVTTTEEEALSDAGCGARPRRMARSSGSSSRTPSSAVAATGPAAATLSGIDRVLPTSATDSSAMPGAISAHYLHALKPTSLQRALCQACILATPTLRRQGFEKARERFVLDVEDAWL